MTICWLAVDHVFVFVYHPGLSSWWSWATRMIALEIGMIMLIILLAFQAYKHPIAAFQP